MDSLISAEAHDLKQGDHRLTSDTGKVRADLALLSPTQLLALFSAPQFQPIINLNV